ncbi:MAG TPA: glycosyltransferase family 1 protein [Sphingomicrobium sp.]|nr:glycosyltransferase family 1 protein [Sphingomicrobium sp.]
MSDLTWTRQLESAAGMRVALFSGNYNYTRDGANNALNKLVAHLLTQGAEVRVFSPTSRNPAFEPTGELVSVPSIAIPGRSEFRVALGLPASIRQQLREFQPNIVHLSAPDFLGTAAQRFARELNVPVVASLHTRFETYFEYYGLRLLHDWAWQRQSRFYRASDFVLAPNEPSRTHLWQMGVPHARIGIWGRGVEANIFNPKRRDFAWRRELGYRDEEPVILFFGRLVREKGIESFIRTIGEMWARGYRVRPMVVGSGPAELEMKARLGDAAFLGHLEGEALGRAVASADILLNPSLTEAFGNVVLEAMSAGLAVVSADVGSAQALIDNGRSGMLCPPEPDHYADAIEHLIEHPSLRSALGKAAVAVAATNRWPLVLDEVVSAYLALLPSIAATARFIPVRTAA